MDSRIIIVKTQNHTIPCRFRVLVFAAVLGVISTTWFLQAQPAGSVDSTFAPDVGGNYILATSVQPDGRILIGGVFNSVNGEPRNLIARLHADGTIESTNTFNAQIDSGFAVSSIVVQDDGKILLAGNFNSIEGQPRGNIARLNADGTLESTATFDPGSGANGNINTMALQSDGRILIGGDFTSINGQPRGAIARLNTNGALESGIAFRIGTGAGGEVAVVRSIAVQHHGKIVIGGIFQSIDSKPRKNLARLDSDGTLESLITFNPSVPSGGYADLGAINCVLLQPDGRILIGGSFTAIDGQPRGNIARLRSEGGVEDAEGFNIGTGAAGGADGVLSMVLQADGKIVIGGDFSTVNDEPRRSVARLHPNGTLESTNTFDPGTGGNIPFVFGVAQQVDGKILLGGFSSIVNEPLRARIARLVNGAATQTLTIPSHQHVEWLRGGAVPDVEQVTFERSLDGVTWSLLGAGTRTFGASEAESIWLCSGLDLVSGGWLRARGRTIGGNANSSSGLIEQVVPLEFAPEIVVEMPYERSLINGATQSLGAAMVDAQTSLTFYIRNIGNAHLFDLKMTIDGPDSAMFEIATELPAFLEMGGASIPFTIKFTPLGVGEKTATAHITSNDADENPFDITLTGRGQTVPVAGSVDPTFAPELIGSYAQATAVQPDGKFIIGGNFQTVNGEPRINLARFQADGSLESTDTFKHADLAGDVRCVAVQADGKILVGGTFGITRLNSDGTLESTNTFHPVALNDQVTAIALQPDGKILLAGYFTMANDEPRGNIVRLNADGTVESTDTFNTGAGATGGILGLALQSDGKIVIAGDFVSVSGEPRSRVARLNADGVLESTNSFNAPAEPDAIDAAIFCVTVQPDGKILLGGYFTSIDGQPRNRIARLHSDGSVESTNTFNPGSGAIDTVNSIALQADGKILLAGYFSTVNDLARSGFARLHSDGAVEGTDTFNPGSGSYGLPGGITLQADGRLILVGSLTAVNEQPRTLVARLANDAAIQTLTVTNRTRIDWMRGGSAPEVEQVTFEVSTNGGASWTLVANGTRVGGGWEVTGVNLPSSGFIRARGRTIGATFSGSFGLIEQVAVFTMGARAMKEGVLAELIALRAATTDRIDARKLDTAIKHLARSLDANLWTDDNHLNVQRGAKVFHEAALTVAVLCDLVRNKRNQIPDEALQTFIDRIFQADRLLASTAIDDAVAADASSQRVEQAQRFLARGDAKVGDEKCRNGLHDYRIAWQRAARADASTD